MQKNLDLDDLIATNVTPDQKFADKRLYRVGDQIVSSSDIILEIYSCAKNFLIYRGKAGLGWEILDAPAWGGEAIAECQRLYQLALSSLSRRHMSQVISLLSSALSRALLSPEKPELESLFRESVSYIDRFKDDIIGRYAESPDFAIYKTRKGGVEWFHRDLPERLGPVLAEYERLRQLIGSVLPKAYKQATMDMLGSSLSVAFRSNAEEDLTVIFSGVDKFVMSRIISSYRIHLFFVSLLTTIIFLVVLLICGLTIVSDTEYLVAAGSGVVGALVSALQRNNESSIDPYISKWGLFCETLSRLVIGVIFGLLVIILARSELALAPFKDQVYALTSFAFLAGFSERFIPDLMATISSKADGK